MAKMSEIDRIVEEGKIIAGLKGAPVSLPGEASELQEALSIVPKLLSVIEALRTHISEMESGRDLASSISGVISTMMDMVDAFRKESEERGRQLQVFARRISDLVDEIHSLRNEIYGSKSQKSRRNGTDPAGEGTDRCREKADYSGDEGHSSGDDSDNASRTDGQDPGNDDGKNGGGGPKGGKGGKGGGTAAGGREKVPSEYLGNNRGPRGKYKGMKADKVVVHGTRTDCIPSGCHIKKLIKFSEFDRVSYIVEHQYTVAIIEDQFGNEMEYYLPADPEGDRPPHLNLVPGTHGSPELLADMLISRWLLHIPNSRYGYQMKIDGFKSSDNTRANWTKIAADVLRPLLPLFKARLLEVKSYVHMDETWCRVRIKFEGDGTRMGKYYKKYVWCVINKETGICYFLYDNDEDDSRGFRPIETFIGDASPDFQTDSYVAYRQLSALKPECQHLLCWAHVRAKWWICWNTTGDPNAKWFVDKINYLYGVEAECRRLGLSRAGTKDRRNKPDVAKVLNDLKTEADEKRKQIEDGSLKCSDKFLKALNYMLHGWDHLILYIQDGKYDIDNCLAEQAVRPFCLGRKNMEHFSSEKGVEDACVFYTVFETIKRWEINLKQYLIDIFKAYIRGNVNYNDFLPEIYAASHT